MCKKCTFYNSDAKNLRSCSALTNQQKSRYCSNSKFQHCSLHNLLIISAYWILSRIPYNKWKKWANEGNWFMCLKSQGWILYNGVIFCLLNNNSDSNWRCFYSFRTLCMLGNLCGMNCYLKINCNTWFNLPHFCRILIKLLNSLDLR